MISISLRSSSRDGYSACWCKLRNGKFDFDSSEIESSKCKEVECALRCLVDSLQKLRKHVDEMPANLLTVEIETTCSDVVARLMQPPSKSKADLEKRLNELSSMAKALLSPYKSWSVKTVTEKSW